MREITLYLKRTLARLDVTSRSLFALIEPGSCFVGVLLELALAADRIYMLEGKREGDELPPAAITLTGANFRRFPMLNGLARIETRFIDDPIIWKNCAAASTTICELKKPKNSGW